MKHLGNRQSFFAISILALLLAVAIPGTAWGQGRGRGHGRSGIFGNSNNKCGKFVNCHDARDGRVDGRGPRQGQLDDLIRNRRARHRNHDNNSNDLVLRNQRRHRDRDNDNEQSRRNLKRRISRKGILDNR